MSLGLQVGPVMCHTSLTHQTILQYYSGDATRLTQPFPLIQDSSSTDKVT